MCERAISGGAGRCFEVIIFLYGILLIVCAVLGHSNPAIWEDWRIVAKQETQHFIVVKSMQQLDDELARARSQKKPVLLDFYADWWVACVTMEKEVWNNLTVQDALSHFVLLQANVTDNNNVDRAMLDLFNVIAPPTIIFFDRQGNESIKDRIEGEVSAKQFLVQLAKMGEMKRDAQ